nr:hypothetical protein [Burkholderia metallica]
MATTRFEARVETDVLAVIRRAAEIQGRTMSVNALRRAASSEIPAVALTVDAKDEGAAAFSMATSAFSPSRTTRWRCFCRWRRSSRRGRRITQRREPGFGRLFLMHIQCR